MVDSPFWAIKRGVLRVLFSALILLFVVYEFASAQVLPTPTPPCTAQCPDVTDDRLCGASGEMQNCRYVNGICMGSIVCSGSNSTTLVPCSTQHPPTAPHACRQGDCRDICRANRAVSLASGAKCTGGNNDNCGGCLCKKSTTTGLKFISCGS